MMIIYHFTIAYLYPVSLLHTHKIENKMIWPSGKKCNLSARIITQLLNLREDYNHATLRSLCYRVIGDGQRFILTCYNKRHDWFSGKECVLSVDRLHLSDQHSHDSLYTETISLGLWRHSPIKMYVVNI